MYVGQVIFVVYTLEKRPIWFLLVAAICYVLLYTGSSSEHHLPVCTRHNNEGVGGGV